MGRGSKDRVSDRSSQNASMVLGADVTGGGTLRR